MYRWTILLTAMLFAFAIGCSGGDDNPVTPDSEQNLTADSGVNSQEPQTHLWGYYNVTFDIENQTVEVIPDRDVMFAANVVSFLNDNPASLEFDINDTPVGPDSIGVDIDVSIVHPIPGNPAYDGYDVRGIFIGDGSLTMDSDPDLTYAEFGTDQFCTNADGYTRWFNPGEFTEPGVLGFTDGLYATNDYTGSATLNPYKYFTDGLDPTEPVWSHISVNPNDFGAFTTGYNCTRNYLLNFPTPTPAVKYDYAVVASWKGEDLDYDHPGNCIEAPAISYNIEDAIYYVDDYNNGGILDLQIHVWGWNHRPSRITIESSVLSTPYVDSDPTPVSGGGTVFTYEYDVLADNVTKDTVGMEWGEEVWIILEYSGFDYDEGEFGFPAPDGPLVACFRYDLFVADESYHDPGEFIWAKQAGGTDNDYVSSITTLSDNSTVITGCFIDSATFGVGESSETTLTSSGFKDMFVARYDNDGTLLWATKAGGTSTDVGRGITSLSDDSTIITGYFNGTSTFGAGEANETSLISEGYSDIFIAQYNSDGTLAWARRDGGSDYDEGYEVTTLSDDSFVVTGLFEGTATFGAGETNETTLVSPNVWDSEIFVARYNSDGTLAWATQAGGMDWDYGYSITALSDDSTVCTGYFLETATFGDGETNETQLISYGGEDIFIAKYNPDGTLAWAKSAGGTDEDVGAGITSLSDESAVITGYFMDTVTFGAGETNETQLVATGFYNLFIARYNADGTLSWAKRAGSPDSINGFAITSLSNDSIIATGQFYGTATFGPGETNETQLVSSGSSDIFIARYNPDGTFLWARKDGGTNTEDGKAITTLSDNSLVCTGTFAGTPTFGSGQPNETDLVSEGAGDIFVARYWP